MNDAVLRFLVELKDEGLTKLEARLLGVGKASTTMAAQTTKAGAGVETSLNRVAAAEASAARRSVESAAVRQTKLKENAAAYRALAASYEQGSQQQVAAMLLAEKAEQRLARETAIATGQIKRNYLEAGAAAGLFERDVNHAVRGAISASGLISKGRTALALGSTAFLGGATLGLVGRSIYDESTRAENVQNRLEAQLKASGVSKAYEAEIEKVVAAQSKLAAIDDEDVKSALTDLLRTTGDLRASYKLLGVAEDVAAGKHIKLSTATAIVSRVYAGSLGILKRYGIVLGSDIKTPLEALIALQDKFAGQAEIAGTSTAGAFEKAQNAFRNFEEGIGHGALPVITAELNKLTGAIDTPSLQNAGERFGHAIATNVGDAIDTVVREVRANWPEIKQDVADVETVLKTGAGAAHELAGALHELVGIVPAKGSVLQILAELYLGKRVLFGKGAKGAAAAAEGGGASGGLVGFVESLLGGAAGAKAMSIRGAKGPVTLAIVAGGSIVADAVHDIRNNDRERAQEKTLYEGDNGVSVYAKGGHIFQQTIPFAGGPIQTIDITKSPEGQRYLEQLQAQKKTVVDINSEYRRLAGVASGTWRDVAQAIRASGGDLDANKKKLEDLVKTEQQLARQRVQLLDDAFSRVTDDVGQAFDAKTQQMLDSLSYRVDVVAKGIRESFTLTGDELTPAERELNALEQLQQRRQLAQGISDAELQLGQALQLGDPQQIEQAQQQLDQAQLAKREYALQQRAAIERKAADASRKRAEQDLQARRDLERRNLDDTLTQLLKEAEKGKLAGGKLAAAVVDELRRYGVDFKNAGDLLGSAFTEQLNSDLHTSQIRADNVTDALDRVAGTKKKIGGLADEIHRLAAELKRAQQNAAIPPLNARIVGGVPKHSFTPGHAAGGVIAGLGLGDTVPAMLTPGEIVLNASQQRGLAARLGIPGAMPDRLFREIQRFAGGGVVERRLLHLLGLDAIQNVAALKRMARLDRAHRPIPRSLLADSYPVHVEDLVRNAGGHLSRDDKLALDARLAQAQAHPRLAVLVDGTYTEPALGPAALGRPLGSFGTPDLAGIGDATINLTVELDGDVIATKTQRILQRRASR